MYPEFIPIYIGLLIIIILLIVILCLLLSKRSSDNFTSARSNSNINNTTSATGSIVLCKSCATQVNSSERCCPKCGTPR